MTEFKKDKIFKNKTEEDVEVDLDNVDKKSERAKIWTEELRLIKPIPFKPALIIESKDENLIMEFQNTVVDDEFSKKMHYYVALTDYRKVNDKPVHLCVLSGAEKSREVSYRVNNTDTFNYEIIGNDRFDWEKIFKESEEKYNQGINISRKETIYFSLTPLMTKNGNIEQKIEKVANILTKLEDIPSSRKRLCLGIEWLLVDKFVENKELKNSLLCLLGDNMDAMHEYGELKRQDGIEQGRKECMGEIIKKLYDSGMSIKEISAKTEIDIKLVENILNYSILRK